MKQSQSSGDDSSALSELQNLSDQLETSEKERRVLETQLSEANGTVTQLQGEGSCLGSQNTLNGFWSKG